jgi:hypothetical protein
MELGGELDAPVAWPSLIMSGGGDQAARRSVRVEGLGLNKPLFSERRFVIEAAPMTFERTLSSRSTSRQ